MNSLARSFLKTVYLLVFFLAVSCALAAAEEPTPKSSNLTSNPVYQKDCAKCHGKTAEGRHFGGPSLRSEKTSSASADDLRGIITNGKGHMPKFSGKLGSDEIEALVKLIKEANAK